MPLPVAPYANTVPFSPDNTPGINFLAVCVYTCALLLFLPNARSNVYRRSLVQFPRRSKYNFSSSGSRTTTVRSSITRKTSFRMPRNCSFNNKGLVRTATVNVATPLGLACDDDDDSRCVDDLLSRESSRIVVVSFLSNPNETCSEVCGCHDPQRHKLRHPRATRRASPQRGG